MARILYYSVHETLEYDEISLFESIGHTVFSLGSYFPIDASNNPFRPAVEPSPDVEALSAIFERTGCRFVFNNNAETHLTKEFVQEFDIIVVMHDIHFIAKNWEILKTRPVIWRTIGQAMEFYDRFAEPYRREGLQIVRWSPRELLIEDYIGHDAIIRAYKDPVVYQQWRGYLSDSYVTFSSNYKGRYSKEYSFFEKAANGLSYKVGGGSNNEIPNAIGLVDFEYQCDLLVRSFGYIYFHGTEIPYTLNFIEAWLTGLPMIVIDRKAKIDGLDFRYNEVNDFVVNGVNGFKVETPAEANSLLASLLTQRDVAAEVGRRGRLSALALFGKARAEQEWSHLFDRLSR